MSGAQNIRSWWNRRKAVVSNERGLTVVEYTPLLAVIALVVFFALSALGGQVSDLLGGAECQAGGDWTKQHVWSVTNADKKQALDEDLKGNGDGMVCTKNPSGGGNGNQGNNQNVKDNDQ